MEERRDAGRFISYLVSFRIAARKPA